MKNKILLILAVFILLTGVVAAAMVAREIVKRRQYSDKGELETMLDNNGRFTNIFLNENESDRLSPIEADSFMFYVPQDKGYISKKVISRILLPISMIYLK